MRKILLSHATTDRLIAQPFVEYLEDSIPDAEFFLSSRPGDIPAGEEWDPRVKEEIRNADIYVILLTANSVTRPWVWFETGAGWMSDRTLIVVTAGGLARDDVPVPLRDFQLLSIEVDDELAAIVRKLGGTPGHTKSTARMLAAMAAQCISSEGWEGVDVDGRYFAWAGPRLHALAGLDPVPTPAGLREALNDAGRDTTCFFERDLSNSFELGNLQLFETDRLKWRKKVICPGDPQQVLLVRPPK